MRMRWALVGRRRVAPVSLWVVRGNTNVLLVLLRHDMTTQTQEISQALVLSESQFLSYVEDSQPPMEQMPLDSEVFEVPPTPFLSTFVLNKMCEIIASGVRTNKGFKEVHLNLVAKQVFDFCGQEVTLTQVYNHLRKWRARWIQVSKLRDLSDASWDEDIFSILLEAEHYQGHVAAHPKDAEFLNTPIQNYHKMQQIFSFGLATGKHAMASGQPLGSPMPEYPDTQESDTINVDAPEKDGEHVHVLDRKRKRAAFMDEEFSVFSSMTEAVKEVATAIRESKSVDVHPELYDAVMEQIGFNPEALMVALSHLLDNKA
ncbi:uncharacterized protein [Aegilops tauschii subsp. strangulata]|uniref:uncharacterized protein n=1 Tax=Aegilops tauschii subsp. strangulata TaxID=200361 RepID=UPI00098B5285